MHRKFKVTAVKEPTNSYTRTHPVQVEGLLSGQKFNFTPREAITLGLALLEQGWVVFFRERAEQ